LSREKQKTTWLSWREEIMRKLIPELLFLAVFITACSKQGSQFAGKWVNTTDPCDKIEITRNGGQFLIGKAPATFKDDGTLQAPYALGAITVTYIKSSETLVLVATGAPGQLEYKRDHSSEIPISPSEFAGRWAGSGIMGETETVEITRNGEQFLMSYTLPGLGFQRPQMSQYALTYKDGALRTSGPSRLARDPRFPTAMTVSYVSCSDALVLDNGAGWDRRFGRVK
jgi:hypothetical protein